MTPADARDSALGFFAGVMIGLVMACPLWIPAAVIWWGMN